MPIMYIAAGPTMLLTIAHNGTDIPILLFTLNLSPQIMELARTAGLRGAISKEGISKLPYAIKVFSAVTLSFSAS